MSVSGYVRFCQQPGPACFLCCPLLCEQVIDAYTRMLKAKKGEIDAIVTTAEPLTPPQEKALAAGLKAQVRHSSGVSARLRPMRRNWFVSFFSVFSFSFFLCSHRRIFFFTKLQRRHRCVVPGGNETLGAFDPFPQFQASAFGRWNAVVVLGSVVLPPVRC